MDVADYLQRDTLAAGQIGYHKLSCSLPRLYAEADGKAVFSLMTGEHNFRATVQ